MSHFPGEALRRKQRKGWRNDLRNGSVNKGMNEYLVVADPELVLPEPFPIRLAIAGSAGYESVVDTANGGTMRRSSSLWASVAMLALVWTAAAGEPAADLATYRQHVKPLLDRTCAECHSAKVQKGNFRVDTLDPDIVHGKTLHGWEEVLNKTQVLEMPPPKHATQPTSDERQKLLSWLRQELRLAAKVQSSTGGKGAMRRLTRTEYVQSMKDLLGVTIVDFGQGFPEENRNRETGFANDSREMSFNTTHLSVLLDRARAGLAEALVTGGKPPGLKATLKPAPGRNNNDGEVRKHRTNDVLVETIFDLPTKVPWHEEPQLNGSITLLDGAILLPRVFRDMIGSGAVMGGGVRWHMGAYKQALGSWGLKCRG